MIALDCFLLMGIFVLLHLTKIFYRNFLFFCKGAILFLPPDEQTSKSNKKKQNKSEDDNQIKIMQIEYKHVRDYPMADQYDRIIFLLAALVLYVPIKAAVCYLLLNYYDPQLQLSCPFGVIVCLVLLIYCVKIGLQIFMISSYNIKFCLLGATVANIFFFLVYMLFQQLGTVDSSLQQSVIDYKRHLTIVFGRPILSSMTGNHIIIFVLFLNTLFTIVSVPSIIKFGNWYTKTLKQIYYEDEQTALISDSKQKQQRIQKQLLLKQKSKKCITLLNMYLFSLLIFLIFGHYYIRNYTGHFIANVVSVILVVLMVFVNCYTLKDAIEFNGSFAYKFLGQYLNSDDKRQKLELRKRVIQYLYYTWYHKFQFLFRIIIPLILFVCLLENSLQPTSENMFYLAPKIGQNSCLASTDKMEILQNLYLCNGVDLENTLGGSTSFVNGVLLGAQRSTDIVQTQARVVKYGVMYPHFITQIMSQLLWYHTVMIFGGTVVYILFLRKTVFDI